VTGRELGTRLALEMAKMWVALKLELLGLTNLWHRLRMYVPYSKQHRGERHNIRETDCHAYLTLPTVTYW
jgi:hypothetical protein